MTLFSYCLRFDDGAAPNPYCGVCTLAICKPAIRRAARVGDWVVGLGSKNSDWGDLSRNVVYAMRVSQAMTMREYDEYCSLSLPEKVPDWGSANFKRRVGDCIYDYSKSVEPTIRTSVHDEENRNTDLGGVNVLLSDHFYYFGRTSELLPSHLLSIAHATQGHKSHMNDPYIKDFVEWIEGLGAPVNEVIAEPQLKEWFLRQDATECRSHCATRNEQENALDKTIC